MSGNFVAKSTCVPFVEVKTYLIVAELRQELGLSDLTFLAIGSMVGSGLYVLTGSLARNVAGPSVVISYIIAAIASGFSAVCYAGMWNFTTCVELYKLMGLH